MNDYPIVLAHGIARFDFLLQRFANDLSFFEIDFDLAGNSLNYFKGIARHLRENGFDVFQSSVGFASGVEKRAADLKSEIETALAVRPNQAKVHIIAHSMGGLDARHMIFNHQMAHRVASLTTIGTPHLGSSFADWGIKNGGNHIVQALRKMIDFGGFSDLASDVCLKFKEAAEAAEAANEVVYQTYYASDTRDKIFTPLQPAWDIINREEGENDGLVSCLSQMWTEELRGVNVKKPVRQNAFPISADHLNEVGWCDLNQLRLTNFLNGNLFETVRDYEDRIKDVYLEIAYSLKSL